MAKVTGILKIFRGSALLRTKKGSKFKPGGFKRDPVTGHKYYGTTDEAMPFELDCTLAHMTDTDVVEFSNIVDETIRIQTDTGQVYVVKDATTTEPCELSDGGDMSLKMTGSPAEKE